MSKISTPAADGSEETLKILDAVAPIIALLPGGSVMIDLIRTPLKNHIKEKQSFFFQEIANRVNEHQLMFEECLKKDEFKDILLHVFRILPTLNKEKIKLVANAITNSALIINIDILYEQHIQFIRYIDELPLSEIYLLFLFREHESTIKAIESYQDIYLYFKEILENNWNIPYDKNKFTAACKNLSACHLLHFPSGIEKAPITYFVAGDVEGKPEKIIITELGKEFLFYIYEIDTKIHDRFYT